MFNLGDTGVGIGSTTNSAQMLILTQLLGCSELCDG